ncbi:copper resistance CopC family protein [Nitrosomonas sp.]|uniref:copper resistance CopC family protein n=1 Tax=Nitrosomonas sp. TaxID=42353 RepID=UPI0020853083|nr:copper resistance CopC family protein [Nitrosomonas sp.]GJL75449.1 MAG: copper resistance protein [Nitrosomonas sp.]
MKRHSVISPKPFLLIQIFFISLCVSSPVFAHAILVQSEPKVDSTIDASPQQVGIWFNENVASEFKALAVINSAGKRVDNQDVKQAALDRTHLYATIPRLPPDTYTVRYRVMSADTHIVTGRFTFTVTPPDTAGLESN